MTAKLMQIKALTSKFATAHHNDLRAIARSDALVRVPAAVGETFWGLEVQIDETLPDTIEDENGKSYELVAMIYPCRLSAKRPGGPAICALIGKAVELAGAA